LTLLDYLNSLYAVLSYFQKITCFWAESAFHLICAVKGFTYNTVLSNLCQ